MIFTYPKGVDSMSNLKDMLENLFTSAKSDERSTSAMYREWQKQRDLAAKFGHSHVSEIDAIFSRNI